MFDEAMKSSKEKESDGDMFDQAAKHAREAPSVEPPEEAEPSEAKQSAGEQPSDQSEGDMFDEAMKGDVIDQGMEEAQEPTTVLDEEDLKEVTNMFDSEALTANQEVTPPPQSENLPSKAEVKQAEQKQQEQKDMFEAALEGARKEIGSAEEDSGEGITEITDDMIESVEDENINPDQKTGTE